MNDIVYSTAKKHGVKIYEYANVGNHLHAVLKIMHLKTWAAFIRERASARSFCAAGSIQLKWVEGSMQRREVACLESDRGLDITRSINSLGWYAQISAKPGK